MPNWKCTDAYEMGKEYECPYCKRHVTLCWGCSENILPNECPYCGKKIGDNDE